MSSNRNDELLPRRPSLARQIAPWLFALAILAYMFWQVDFRRVHEILTGDKIRPGLIIAAYLFYCAVYFLTDILSFFRSYNWFNKPIAFDETARLRLASYTVQAINGALTEIMSVLYMLRVHAVRVTHSTSTALFIYFNETLTMLVLLTGCVFSLPEANRVQVEVAGMDLWSVLQASLIAGLAAAAAIMVFFTSGLARRFPKIAERGLATAFINARPANYAEVFSYRMLTNLASLAANIIILEAMNISAPLPLMLAVVPIMVNVAYWPVSAGGFGGPQLVAHYLLAGYATGEEIFAYSLVWSALFFLTRILTGLAFIRPVYRKAFMKGISPPRES